MKELSWTNQNMYLNWMTHQVNWNTTNKALTKDLTNGYNILNGAKYFSSGILQSYLIFPTTKKYFRFFTNASQVLSWKSKGLSEQSIENITILDSIFYSTLISYYPWPDIKFNFNSDFISTNCLFGSVMLTNKADPDKNKYWDYSIRFDSRSWYELICACW